MRKRNIPKKILHWYDNNKRILPWRKYTSAKQKHYFTLVSEFMLQQTQVKTVVPYFINFIKKIPNIKSLSKINDKRLIKCWEGLGYYSRAKNLKKTAIKIISEHKGCLPSNLNDLKNLPGIGDYTSAAILAIAFNKPVIPLDGNIERVIKRIFYLKKEKEIKKENLNRKKLFFGKTNRSSDYAQAIMEMGALICKPKNPFCLECPISKSCTSFKKSDFEIMSKKKFNKIKYFEAEIFNNRDKYLLINNNRFNFLKNLPIFPMREVQKKKFTSSVSKKINIKLSNMDMKIILSRKYKNPNIKNSFMIDKKNIHSKILPSFTKKIIKSVSTNQ